MKITDYNSLIEAKKVTEKKTEFYSAILKKDVAWMIEEIKPSNIISEVASHAIPQTLKDSKIVNNIFDRFNHLLGFNPGNNNPSETKRKELLKNLSLTTLQGIGLFMLKKRMSK
jgi:hypothetical protein